VNNKSPHSKDVKTWSDLKQKCKEIKPRIYISRMFELVTKYKTTFKKTVVTKEMCFIGCYDSQSKKIIICSTSQLTPLAKS